MDTFLRIALFLFCLPHLAAAQTINTALGGIWVLINDFLFPLIFAVAVLAFVFNVLRYFIWGSTESETRAIARRYLIYSILAFVIIVSFWSIFDFIAKGIGVRKDCNKYDPYVSQQQNCD